MQPDAREHILIIKHGALGDIILATGHIRAIREHHPHAHITCLTGPGYVKLLSACPYIDEIWEDKKPKLYDPKGLWALIRLLRSRRFRWVYDLQTSTRSSQYWFFLRFPKPRWSGIGRYVSHPQLGEERHTMHTTVRLNDQLAIAGIVTDGKPDLHWLTADISGFSLPERYALLVPGGAPHRPEKRWPAEHYASMAQMLADQGIAPVLIGTEAEREVLDSIAAAVPACINLCSKTSIAELASLARGARWAVGNDTGPMHIIAAADCPSTVLFSFASNPGKSAPNGAAVTCLQESNLAGLSPLTVWQTGPWA